MDAFFHSFPKKIIHILDPDSKCTEIEYFQMYYGIQTLLYNITITSFILFCSYFGKCFIETLLLFTIFGILRLIAGGFHFNSIIKCVSATTLIMLGIGKCLTIFPLNSSLGIILCTITNTIFFIHIPKGTKNNPYSPEYSQLQKKRLRVISLFLSIIAFGTERLGSIILLSMFIVSIFLIPELIHRSQEVE